MIGIKARSTPAVILLILLALLVLETWLDLSAGDVELHDPAAGLDQISWLGSVAPDGRLAVSVTYDFSDDATHEMDIRVPDGARFLAVDGTPISADIGKYATVEVRTRAIVTYEVPGLVTRFRDGALLRLGQLSDPSSDDPTIDGDEGLFPCPHCYIDGLGFGNAEINGALFVNGAETVRLTLIQLDSLRAQVDASRSSVRFAGIDPRADDVSMLATLPADAVPDLPVGDGSVDDALTTARNELARADRKLATPDDSGGGNVLTAVLVTLIFVALATWVFIRLRWANTIERRERSGDPATRQLALPDDLEPALAGAVVGERGPGSRSVVAATMLELARRNVISLDGTDLRRIVVEVPQGATGATKFEQAVLAELRQSDDPLAAVTRTGPPVWNDHGPAAARRLQLALVREARRQRLMRATLPPVVLVVASLAMGLIAIIGNDDGTVLGWIIVFLGPILGVVATVLGGITLTRRGLVEREAWEGYADWLRTQTDLREANQSDIPTFGAQLSYAAALGAAPEIATALSPRR
jgi:Predicted membrane protein (DUF2207) C-terminal domain